ncbi:hypothetical protein AB8880_01465 [Alphaproteobacteria bacterium LSUCC0684]
MRRSVTALGALLFLNCTSGPAVAGADAGRQLVREHCTRCHVIGDINPYGGIGSTPSFEAMKNLPDWRARFEVFFILPPHPSLVRIEGVSEDRPENLPAFSHEIVLTPMDVENILAYVDTLERK